MLAFKNFFSRKTTGSIKVQSLKNIQTALTQRNTAMWVDLHLLDGQSIVSKKEQKEAKKKYSQIIHNENLITLISIVLQQINFGVQKITTDTAELDALDTNYPNIFRLRMYRARRDELINLAERSQNKALPIKFINKEMSHLNKMIDKAQFKVNEFNRSISIELGDLGTAVEKAYYDLVA